MVPFYPDPNDHGMPRENDRDVRRTPHNDISGEWRVVDGPWQQSPSDSGADHFLMDDDYVVHEVDAALIDRVAERLVTEAEIRGRLVQVMVQNGVVILEGNVESADVKAAAGRLVWATPGVFDVCNMLIADS